MEWKVWTSTPLSTLVLDLRSRGGLGAAAIGRVGLGVDATVLAGVGQVEIALVFVLLGVVTVVLAQVVPRFRPAGLSVGLVVGVAIGGRVHHVLFVVVGVGARSGFGRPGGVEGLPTGPRLAIEGVV